MERGRALFVAEPLVHHLERMREINKSDRMLSSFRPPSLPRGSGAVKGIPISSGSAVMTVLPHRREPSRFRRQPSVSTEPIRFASSSSVFGSAGCRVRRIDIVHLEEHTNVLAQHVGGTPAAKALERLIPFLNESV